MFGGLWSNKKKVNTAFVSLRENLENFPFEAAYAWFFTLSRGGDITQTRKVSRWLDELRPQPPIPPPPYEKSPKIFSKLPPFISGSLWILLKLPLIKSDPRAQPFTARYEKSLNKVNKITLSLLPPPMVGKTCLFIVWCLLNSHYESSLKLPLS